MKTFTQLSSITAALLMTVTMGTAFADEGELTQLHTQNRERLELNLQIPNADFGQPHDRGQKVVMHQNQNQYQYKFMDSSPSVDSSSGNGSMNRYNTMNRNMQGSAVSGSMNRQTTTSRSMGGGRR